MNVNHWIIVIVVTILFGTFQVLNGYTHESDIMFQMIGAFILNYFIASILTKPQKTEMEIVNNE